MLLQTVLFAGLMALLMAVDTGTNLSNLSSVLTAGKDLSIGLSTIKALNHGKIPTVKNIIPSFVNVSIAPQYGRGIAEQDTVSLLQHPLKPMSFMWFLQWLEVMYTGPEFYHIQIGAFTTDDSEDQMSAFITSGSWSSVLVEPQPHVFNRLKEHASKHTNMIPVNAAVCQHDREAIFYMLHEDIDMYTGYDNRTGKTLPSFLSQMASLNRQHLMKARVYFQHEGLDIVEYIVEKRVPCLKIESILNQQSINPASVISLSIDTEGTDDKILLSTDLSVIRPMFIVFECVHWYRDRSRLNKVLVYLTQHGYVWWKTGFEIAAMRVAF